MEIKEEIESVLASLKKAGYERGRIEKDLEYSENYIDQTLSKGGNRKFLRSLKNYAERVLQKTITPLDEPPFSHVNEEPVEYKKTGIQEEYLALLKKTIADKDKNIEEKEADIKAYRSAIQKITSVDEKVAALEFIVNDLRDKVGGDISNIEVLREWLIDQFSKLKKESPQSVAASMGTKREELYQKAKQRGTHAG